MRLDSPAVSSASFDEIQDLIHKATTPSANRDSPFQRHNPAIPHPLHQRRDAASGNRTTSLDVEVGELFSLQIPLPAQLWNMDMELKIAFGPFCTCNPGRERGRGGRDSGRSGRGSNFERGQSSQQNWRGRGRGQRGGRSNHSNFECYKCGKYGHYAKDCNSFKCYNCDKVGHLAKDCRIEKKVEETTNLTLEAEANEGFLLMAQNEINTNDNVWYLDSGASNHMCGHKHLFKEMRKIEDGNVSFGDASKGKVEGKGTIRYLQKDGLIGSIQDVYYVPNLKTNILSLGQLTEKGYSILMKERILHLKDKLGHLIARVELEKNRMYKLNLINVREKCLQVSVEDKASLWHLRFGHLHHAGLKRC
ncbi:hypothetical protein KIW84_024397 [Lathyrus oleraceus]|uniref:CCHC-type domain-containing protein n=1 Tax=Pisum sativum TaxID=3888 RepID=A0A9D4YFI1_PEA|nr:hypothetical protein KIW84_024397 [Pisum sativum]